MEEHFKVDYGDICFLEDLDESQKIGLVESTHTPCNHGVTPNRNRYVTSFRVVNHLSSLVVQIDRVLLLRSLDNSLD